MLLCVSACTSRAQESPIIGVWTRESFSYDFRPDGSAVMSETEDGGIVDWVLPRISWRRTGLNTFQVNFYNRETRRNSPHLGGVENNQLVLRSPEGELETFHR
jgi:hypothetical protein